MTPGLLLLLLALAPDGGVEEAPASALKVRGGLELGAQLLPSRGGEGVDGYLVAHPLLRLEVSDVFSLQVGAALRVDVLDLPPPEAGGLLRPADWDEVSDYGQLLEDLSLGTEGGPVSLRAGPVHARTLGFGHLVSRYSNQENADYHPAAATLVAAVGPVRGELFASDVLGARLFAGELGWDLGRTFTADAEAWDRWQLALEVAHDASRAGLPTRVDPGQDRAHPAAVTLAHLDASGVLVRLPAFGLTALAGAGLRLDRPAPTGFLLGAAVDARLGALGLSVKLEGRSQGGGFRQGWFGPGWELARYADTGLSGPGQAGVDLPPGFSLALEARLGLGTALSLGAAVEHFFFGRTDLDASLALALARGAVVAEARYGVVGLGRTPRHAVSAALRFRVAPSFYLLAAGGTAFLPRPDGTLQRGLSVALGLGLDFGGQG